MKTKLLFASILFASIGSALHGQTTYNWENPVNGNLDDVQYWTPEGFDPSGAQMVFGTSGSYRLGLQEDMAARYVILRGASGTVTFDLNGKNLDLSNTFQVLQNAELVSGRIQGTIQVGLGVSDKTFTIAGQGATFSAASGAFIGRNNGATASSGHQLIVSDGGSFIGAGSLTIGDNRGGGQTNGNTFTVTGSGSSLMAGGLLIANLDTNGTNTTANNNKLVITNGATAQFSSITIARRNSGVTLTTASGNQMIVGGGASASTVTTTGSVSVGNTGTNNILKIEKGGTMIARNAATTINNGAGTALIIEGGEYLADGQKVTIYGSSSLNISDDGKLDAGTLDLRATLNMVGKGTINVDQLALLDSTTINITLGSSTEYGQINIGSSTAELGFTGKFSLTFSDGFQASAGNEFKFFSFNQAFGEFLAIELPDLAPGLQWDTSNLYSTGTIAVIPEPSGYALSMVALGLVSGLLWAKRERQP